MKTEIFRVAVPEDVLCYLQRLTFELEGLRTLNCQIARSETAKTSWHKRYLREYKKKSAEHQLAFGELVRELAPQYANHKSAPVLDFHAGALVVYEEEPDGCRL